MASLQWVWKGDTRFALLRCLLRTCPAALAGAALPCRGYLEGHCKHELIRICPHLHRKELKGYLGTVSARPCNAATSGVGHGTARRQAGGKGRKQAATAPCPHPHPCHHLWVQGMLCTMGRQSAPQETWLWTPRGHFEPLGKGDHIIESQNDGILS